MTSPRRRARVAAEARIRAIARRQLAQSGPAAVSLREIAKEMGLVSSAIYRYVSSREALLTSLIAAAYDGLGHAAETADADLARDDLAGRWRALAGSLRDWARANPADYALVYGAPLPGYDAPPETYAPAQRWIEVMIDILVRGAQQDMAPPQDPDLVARLQALRDARAPTAPLGTIAAGLSAWAQLHGLVALEIHGQWAFVLGEGESLFHHTVDQQIHTLGLADRHRRSRLDPRTP